MNNEAVKLLDELLAFYELNDDVDLVPILYKNSKLAEKSIRNKFSRVRQNKASDKLNKEIIRLVRSHKTYISIDYSDIYNFFIEKEVCHRFKQEKYQRIEGLYLLLRHSNTLDNKISVSYLDVTFENNTLLFKSERNNLYTNQDRHVPICIETKGMINANTNCSYFGIGISTDIANPNTRTFIETMVIYKNRLDDNSPIAGYWSGNIVANNEDPFLSKIILIKIKNPESEKEIRNSIKSLNDDSTSLINNGLIKLHTKEELSNKDGIFYKIINAEKYNNIPKNSMLPIQSTQKTIEHILNGLDITVDKNKNIIHLERFM